MKMLKGILQTYLERNEVSKLLRIETTAS